MTAVEITRYVMLTVAQFQQWCLHLHLSPQASEVVARVRSSPPARRVGSRANNVSGTYASRKMGCTIQFESHKDVLGNRLPTVILLVKRGPMRNRRGAHLWG